MTDFSFPSTWSAALDALSITAREATTPSGESEEWAQALTHFSTRGYMMLFLKPQATGVSARLDFVLPDAERSASFGREVAARLRVLGARDAELKAAGPPAIVKAGFGDLDEDRARTILLLLLKISDYISQLEKNPEATSPLEAVDQPEGSTILVADDADQPAKSSSGFEAIGGGDKTSEEAPERETPAKKPASSAFEAIGKDAPAAPASKESRAADDGETHIQGSDLFLSRGVLHLAVALTNFPGAARQDAIRNALARILRTRFDARVSNLPEVEHNLKASPEQIISFELEPALTTASDEDVRRLRDDLERYLDRLARFGEMGMALDELLDLPGSAAASARPARSDKRERVVREEPRRETEREEEGSGFVLDLGSKSTSHDERDEEDATPLQTLDLGDGNDSLTPGDFENPELKREDATTPLVDVVLRHPGYSDKNICQVLTILLSIEYSQALATIQNAPCVIAWGVGVDRAQTFRNVIEGAGGKVLLVEPGTFGNS